MKTDRNIFIRLLVLFLILFLNVDIHAQEFDLADYRVRFTFSTLKDIDDSRQLQVTFLATNKKDRKDRIPIKGALIKFQSTAQDTVITIGEIKTGDQGIAKITIPESLNLLKNEEGYFEFTALFDKTKVLKKQKKTLQVKDLLLDMTLSNQDSIKTVSLNAYTLDSLESKQSIEELDLVFSVGGMLSKLPIEEGSLEDGVYTFEIKKDIQGDINGDFELFAFVDDHDEYGTVLKMVKSDWGVFDDIRPPEKNKLWTEAAPIWMYIVLTILLVGVWANYLYAIVKLLKIKKIGKNIA